MSLTLLIMSLLILTLVLMTLMYSIALRTIQYPIALLATLPMDLSPSKATLIISKPHITISLPLLVLITKSKTTSLKAFCSTLSMLFGWRCWPHTLLIPFLFCSI